MEAVDAVAGKPLLHCRDYGNTACHRSAIKQLATVPTCQFLQRRSLLGNHFLVCRDHGPARRQRSSYPVTGGVQAACQFDDDVGLGVQNLVEIFGPEYR